MSDKELISEALRWANGHPNRRSSELMRALADALAAVPDAATELRAERDAALAAIERVRAIHKVKHGEKPVWALGGIQGVHKPTRFEKYSMCEGRSATWPCPTVAALDGAPEPEEKS